MKRNESSGEEKNKRINAGEEENMALIFSLKFAYVHL